MAACNAFTAGAGALLAVCAFGCAVAQPAMPARAGWLRYAIPPDPPRYHDMPHAVVVLGDAAGQAAPEEQAAAEELDRGLGHMVAGTDQLSHRFDPRVDSIVLGTTDAMRRAHLSRMIPGWTDRPLPEEGFRIVRARKGLRQWWILQGGSPRAELYAAFRFAALVAEDRQLPDELAESPRVGLRALELRDDSAAVLTLMKHQPGDDLLSDMTARLLASVGINGLVMDGADLAAAAQVAAELRPFGVRVWLRVAVPAGDARADEQAANALLAAVPGLGGVVLDAHGDAGGGDLRRLAATANAMARVMRRRGATVLLRDALGEPLRSADSSGPTPEQRAAMLPAMEPNVVVTGSLASGLLPLAGLGSANFGLVADAQAAELELLPAQRQVVFPVAAWQEALATPERGLKSGDTTLVGLLAAESGGGLIAALEPGDLERMLGQPLLLANLYGFGRMAWNPTMDAEAVAEAWARQTWGDDARVYRPVTGILLESRGAVAGLESPMGLPLLGLPVVGGTAGGPDPQRAAKAHGVTGAPLAGQDSLGRDGIGVDRTARGTGEIGRYPTVFAATLSDAARCPAEWLLALHRVPYDHVLPGGKTVAQNFYDLHFNGAAQAANAVDEWEETRGLVDPERYAAVHRLLEDWAPFAEIWRDAGTEWLLRVARVPDALGFAGKHAGRTEAEAMELKGYSAARLAEAEDASGGGAVVCNVKECSATLRFRGEANVYRVETGYFADAGATHFELLVNGAPPDISAVLAKDAARGEWTGEMARTTPVLTGEYARRVVINGVRLKPGDSVTLRAVPANGGAAALDFVEITRDPRWN